MTGRVLELPFEHCAATEKPRSREIQCNAAKENKCANGAELEVLFIQLFSTCNNFFAISVATEEEDFILLSCGSAIAWRSGFIIMEVNVNAENDSMGALRRAQVSRCGFSYARMQR